MELFLYGRRVLVCPRLWDDARIEYHGSPVAVVAYDQPLALGNAVAAAVSATGRTRIPREDHAWERIVAEAGAPNEVHFCDHTALLYVDRTGPQAWELTPTRNHGERIWEELPDEVARLARATLLRLGEEALRLLEQHRPGTVAAVDN